MAPRDVPGSEAFSQPIEIGAAHAKEVGTGKPDKVSSSPEDVMEALRSLQVELKQQHEQLEAQKAALCKVVGVVGAPQPGINDQMVAAFFDDLDEMYRRGQKLISNQINRLSQGKTSFADPSFWIVAKAYLDDRAQKIEQFSRPFQTDAYKKKLKPHTSNLALWAIYKAGSELHSQAALREMTEKFEKTATVQAIVQNMVDGIMPFPDHRSLQKICDNQLASRQETVQSEQPRIQFPLRTISHLNWAQGGTGAVIDNSKTALSADPEARMALSVPPSSLRRLREWMVRNMKRDLSAYPLEAMKSSPEGFGFWRRQRLRRAGYSNLFQQKGNIAMNTITPPPQPDDTVLITRASSAPTKDALQQANADAAAARAALKAARQAQSAARHAEVKNRSGAAFSAIRGFFGGMQAGFAPVAIAKERANAIEPATPVSYSKAVRWALDTVRTHRANNRETKAAMRQIEIEYADALERREDQALEIVRERLETMSSADPVVRSILAASVDPYKAVDNILVAVDTGGSVNGIKSIQELEANRLARLSEMQVNPFRSVVLEIAQGASRTIRYGAVAGLTRTARFFARVDGFVNGAVTNSAKQAVRGATTAYKTKRGLTLTPGA